MSEKKSGAQINEEVKADYPDVFEQAQEIYNRSEDEKKYRQQAVCVAVKEFVEDDGTVVKRVLLVKSQKALDAGKEAAWGLPQGGADSADETTEDVAVREFGEEIKLSEEINADDMIRVGETYRQDFDLRRICEDLNRPDPRDYNGKQYRHVAFKTSGEIIDKQDSEVKEAVWVTVEDAEKVLSRFGNPKKVEQQMNAIREGIQAVG